MSAGWLAVIVAIAGGAGSALRHAVDTSVPVRWRESYPWGILIINLTGSFALGCVTGLMWDHPLAAIIGSGLLGGYTTFSTASLDTAQLLMARRWGAALVNGVGMLVVAVVLAIAGLLCGALLR